MDKSSAILQKSKKVHFLFIVQGSFFVKNIDVLICDMSKERKHSWKLVSRRLNWGVWGHPREWVKNFREFPQRRDNAMRFWERCYFSPRNLPIVKNKDLPPYCFKLQNCKLDPTIFAAPDRFRERKGTHRSHFEVGRGWKAEIELGVTKITRTGRFCSWVSGR